jgi:hypothetical protein
MRGIRFVPACLTAALLGACGGGRGGDGGISGDPAKLPPKEILEAPLSLGDIADTSSCFRTQQLILQLTGSTAGWKWKKMEDATWEYSVPIVAPDGKKGTARLRLANIGNQVRVVEYHETQVGQDFTHLTGTSIGGYMHSAVVTLKQSGARPIPDCADPSTLPLKYE